jgi:hypothetical protein
MKTTKHTVTFSQVGAADVMALAMAKVGASDTAIKKKCFLSGSQISYRLAKAKRMENRNKGYRVAYRNGESPEFKRIMTDYLDVIELDITRKLPKLLMRPPAEFAPTNGHKKIARK